MPKVRILIGVVLGVVLLGAPLASGQPRTSTGTILDSGAGAQSHPTVASWSLITTGATHPAVRADAAIAHDAADHYVVLFGGVNATKLFGDT